MDSSAESAVIAAKNLPKDKCSVIFCHTFVGARCKRDSCYLFEKLLVQCVIRNGENKFIKKTDAPRSVLSVSNVELWMAKWQHSNKSKKKKLNK